MAGAVRPARQMVKRDRGLDEVILGEVTSVSEMLNDPTERPISEFADLEKLAEEIEEVTSKSRNMG